MEILETILENRLSKRYLILQKIDYHIEESVYYRTFSEEISSKNRTVLYNIKDAEGKLKIL
jgi:hypothetical protein